MQAPGVLVAPRPRLPLRVILGLCATGISLLTLMFPGALILPAYALMPVYPRATGCMNFIAPVVFLAFLGVGVVITLVLIVNGITAIALAATRRGGGVVIAVLVNATIATLLLVMPLSAAGQGPLNQSDVGLYTLTAVCAVFPLAGIILLLAPSMYGSSRTHAVTLIATGLLLLPGAAGLTVLGLDLAGAAVFQAPSNAPVTQTAHC